LKVGLVDLLGFFFLGLAGWHPASPRRPPHAERRARTYRKPWIVQLTIVVVVVLPAHRLLQFACREPEPHRLPALCGFLPGAVRSVGNLVVRVDSARAPRPPKTTRTQAANPARRHPLSAPQAQARRRRPH
jgi:hypothetical protein